MAKSKSRKPALGQGLEAIFGQDVTSLIEDIETSGKSSATEIPVSDIIPNPYQPRTVFDETALNELADSIREHGIFTPLILRQYFDKYQIVAGERRFRAAKIVGLQTVPAIIVEFNDEQMMEIAILENVQRENLNPIEEAVAYNNLMTKFGYTQEVLAKRVGKSREYCANVLRLLKLPLEVRDLVSKGKLALGHVRPLITLKDEDQIIELANRTVEKQLSVREVEKIIQNIKNGVVKKEEVKEDPFLVNVSKIMENKLQTKVSVDKKKITIKYSNVKDLNRILELLDCLEEE